jgi:hypothetical protein
MTDLWNTIFSKLGKKVWPPQGKAPLYLFKVKGKNNATSWLDDTNWLVGEYQHLAQFASGLRENQDLQDFMSEHRIRIGLRKSDVAPTGKQEKGYGPLVEIPGGKTDHSSDRQNPVSRPLTDFADGRLNPVPQPAGAASGYRRTDHEANVKKYWESQTPQSHHIVEFNNLEKLCGSRKKEDDGRWAQGEMDYQQLPAVLLAAEFHQRYISIMLKSPQKWDGQTLKSSIDSVYRALYLQNHVPPASERGGAAAEPRRLLEPLWDISLVILKQASLMSVRRRL